MRAVALAAAVVALLAGCGSGTPKGGDPGDRRLHRLAADPIFSARAPGAQAVTITQIHARYVEPGFTGGGWHGPAVVAAFESAAPPRTVFRFYGRRAQAAGWRVGSSGALHLTDLWRKTYRDGARATLLLSLLDLRTTIGPRRYTLSGGISLPSDDG
jgi:hypothetical protein